MSVSYIGSLKSTRMQNVIAALDANASPAIIEIATAGMVLNLVSVTLSKPSFTESGGSITMSGAPKSGTANGSGIAAAARIKDGGGNIIVAGLTVGTAGSDINLNNVNITAGQVVTISNFAITHSP